MADPAEILIACHTADAICTVGFTESLVAAIEAIAAAGLRHRYATLDYYDIVTARNHLAHYALTEDRVGHVLFIDNDVRVARPVFERLIAAGKPVAGGIFTRRAIDLEAYARARAEGHDEAAARALASQYNVRLGGGRLRIEGGLAQLEALGFGCVLIETRLLRRLAGTGRLGRIPAIPRTGFAPGTVLTDFFSELPQPDGSRLSDDISFCTRVQEVEPGGVWGYVGPGIAHVGQFSYGAPFQALLRAQAARRGGA